MTAVEKTTPNTPRSDVKLREARDFRKQSGATTAPVTPKIEAERFASNPVAPALTASAETRSPIIIEYARQAKTVVMATLLEITQMLFSPIVLAQTSSNEDAP